MNYLTNYYKNLSEQLQAKVNVLEQHSQQLNEAISSTANLYGNRPFLDSGGGFMPGDYNGDGRVDGADLGIALGGYGQPGYDFQSVLQNWYNPQTGVAGPAFRSTRAGGGRQNVRGVEPMNNGAFGGGRQNVSRVNPTNAGAFSGGQGIPGDYNGDGRVDGADLAIALGNYGQPGYNFQTTLQNWTGPMGVAGQAFRSTSGRQGRQGRQIMTRPEEVGAGAAGDRIPGDYNGDGRVDGADLGIALGSYGQPGYNFQTTLQNWTGPMAQQGPATFRSAPPPLPPRRPTTSKGTYIGPKRPGGSSFTRP